MPSVQTLMPSLTGRADKPSSAAAAYGLWTVAAVGILTGLRLACLWTRPVGLYPDEAQYWFWAQHLAFGYYSKPPLVAWTIALTTSLFGDGEFAVRLAAPLLHALTAALVFAIGARLYERRTGFWSALAYASLPGVSLSAFIISTDAVLLPCWAAALYAFIRAREPGGGRWWALAGIAAGLGLLAKYAMIYWFISAFAVVLLIPGERRHLKALCAASALAALLYLPNFWWNWSNGFVSYLHVRDNADLVGSLFHPLELLKFVASQSGVIGPLFFLWLLALIVRPRTLAQQPAYLLAGFAVPALALVTVQSLLSRAEPNWAAPAYVSGIVLVVAWVLCRGWQAWLTAAVAINLLAAVLLFGMTDALSAVGIAVPAKYDPLHRMRYWPQLGDRVAALLASQPGLTLLADDRELLAALIYYVRPHPLNAVEWNPIPGITDQWRLVNNIGNHRGEDFLAVTEHNLVDEMRPDFAQLIPLTTITDPSRSGGSPYHIYIARDFRGSSRQHR